MEEINIIKIKDLVWTPVRTKPRHEKKLLEYCIAHSVPTYLPLVKSVKRYGNRTVEHQIPMFRSYVFCALNEDNYRTLLQSGTVLFRISMTDIIEKQLILDLQVLHKFEKASLEKEVIVHPEIVKGVEIAVTSGSFMGVTGIVEQRKNDVMITVNIELLGQSVSALIDIGDVALKE